jgi:hypothetical protein
VPASLTPQASWAARIWALLEQPDVPGCVKLVEWETSPSSGDGGGDGNGDGGGGGGRTHIRFNLNIADYVGGGRLFNCTSVNSFYRQLNL